MASVLKRRRIFRRFIRNLETVLSVSTAGRHIWLQVMRMLRNISEERRTRTVKFITVCWRHIFTNLWGRSRRNKRGRIIMGNRIGYSQLLEGLEVGGFGVTWLEERDQEEEEKTRGEEEATWGEMDCEHMARRNSKYLGYTTGEVARPAVRKVD